MTTKGWIIVIILLVILSSVSNKFLTQNQNNDE